MEIEASVRPFVLRVILKSGRIVGYTEECGVQVVDGALLITEDGTLVSGYAPGEWEAFNLDKA